MQRETENAQFLLDPLLDGISITSQIPIPGPDISNFSETDEGKLVVELQEVKTIEINKNDDLKNKEIILSFSVDTEKKEINIYTASDTNYKIVFIKSSISMKEED